MIKHVKRGTAVAVNRIFKRLGLAVVRTTPSWGDLSIYPETERPNRPTYVNIGAGAFRHPLWHNLDTPNSFYSADQSIHIPHDLSRAEPLPLGSGTLAAAYSSHVVEHLRDATVESLFAEVLRCLRPDGVFRVTCPDADLLFDAYERGDAAFFPWPSPWGLGASSLEQRFLEMFATVLAESHPFPSSRRMADRDVQHLLDTNGKEDALNYLKSQIPFESVPLFPQNHINWFNEERLVGLLKRAGYSSVYVSRYGQSRCPLMRQVPLFDGTVPHLSLYVECAK